MAAFRLTPAAEEHIGDIVEFIATDNEDAGKVAILGAIVTVFAMASTAAIRIPRSRPTGCDGSRTSRPRSRTSRRFARADASYLDDVRLLHVLCVVAIS
jgi:plasmid stabilization system protein ParE